MKPYDDKRLYLFQYLLQLLVASLIVIWETCTNTSMFMQHTTTPNSSKGDYVVQIANQLLNNSEYHVIYPSILKKATSSRYCQSLAHLAFSSCPINKALPFFDVNKEFFLSQFNCPTSVSNPNLVSFKTLEVSQHTLF